MFEQLLYIYTCVLCAHVLCCIVLSVTQCNHTSLCEHLTTLERKGYKIKTQRPDQPNICDVMEMKGMNDTKIKTKQGLSLQSWWWWWFTCENVFSRPALSHTGRRAVQLDLAHGVGLHDGGGDGNRGVTHGTLGVLHAGL